MTIHTLTISLSKTMLIATMCTFFGNAWAIKTAKKPKESAPPIYYDLRGIYLGMSIDDFRTAEPIAKKSQITRDYRYAEHNIFPACSGDAEGADWIRPPRGTEEYGGKTCQWSYFPLDPRGTRSAKKAEINLGGILTSDYSFQFIKSSSDNSPVLYRIYVSIKESAFLTIKAALQEKFGAPTSTIATSVTTAMGVTMPSEIAVWDNPAASIKLVQRAQKIDESTLWYELKSQAKFSDELITNKRINDNPM